MGLKMSNFIPAGILLITICSISHLSKIPINNTTVWWTVQALVLISFISAKRLYFDNTNSTNLKLLFLYLLWNTSCIVRGMFVAENYWEWKNLVSKSLVLLLPLTIYVSTSPRLMQQIVAKWFKYALPAFVILIPIINQGDAFGRYLVPVGFLLLFFPLIPAKWRFILVGIAVFVIASRLDARSSVIKYSAALVFAFGFYFFRRLPVSVFQALRLVLLCVPILLFTLAVSGIFNVFKMDEYIKGDYTTKVETDGEVKEESLLVDTRTFLYEEVISSALNHNYVMQGRTPARGNDSQSFGAFALEQLKTGKMERFGNEVCILNLFTWTGLVGVVLYFLIFFKASYLAIARSNNMVMKFLGLYICFRWTYAWVEDFSNFELSYIFLWFTIGMCFSKSFRKMDDMELKLWVRGVFDKRYAGMELSTDEPGSYLIDDKAAKEGVVVA